MKYTVLFLLLGAVLAHFGRTADGGIGLMSYWPAASCVAVSVSYLFNSPTIFGKRQSGKLNPISTLLLLPYLLFTWGTWHLVRILSRENAFDTLDEKITIGRRLLPDELPSDLTNIVDLTAEFPEAQAVVGNSNYFTFPILDASTVTPEQLQHVVTKIDELDGSVYIHCAQGHGRTGFVTAALMIHRKPELSVDDAIRKLQKIRPALSCNKSQIDALEKWRSVG